LKISLLPGIGSSENPSDSGIIYATLDPATIDQPPIANPAGGAGAGARTVTILGYDVFRQILPQFLDVYVESLDAAETCNFDIWGNE
jgi:hypothetical protein